MWPRFLSVSLPGLVQGLVQLSIIWYHVNKLVSKGEREDWNGQTDGNMRGGGNKTSSVGELLKKEQQVKANFGGEILMSDKLSTLLALKA